MNKFKQLINVHSHSDASLDGAATIKQIVNRNKELGATHVVATEHGNMNSAMDLYKTCLSAGVKPILGIEAYMVNPFHDEYVDLYRKAHAAGLVKTRAKDPDKVEAELQNKAMGQYLHVTIHFKDEEAYQYFNRLSQKMWARAIKRWDEVKPMITLEELEGIRGHITVTSSCLKGPVQSFLLPSRDGIIPADPQKAEFMYNRLREIAGKDNFFVEVFPHAITKNWKKPTIDMNTKRIVAPGEFVLNECSCGCPGHDIQKKPNQFVYDLAVKNGDKAVISLDSHFAEEKQKLIQDMRLGNGTEQWKFSNSYHVMTSDEAASYLQKEMGLTDKEIEKMIDNSYEFANLFNNFKIKTSDDRWVLEDTGAEFSTRLKSVIDKYGRMDYSNPEMVDRLKMEMKVLAHNGKINLLPYFSMVEDIANFCKHNDVLINVRGSAGGSLLLYLIGVSSVNPLKHGLSFERFLTEGRIKANTLPDADIDVSDQEKVFGYLKEKHGDKFCRISIDVLLKIKSTIKDTERHVYGSVRKETEDLCKKLPSAPQGVTEKDHVFGYIDASGVAHKGILDTCPPLAEYAKNNKAIWETVSEALGIQRQKSPHPCGIVIADKAIEEYCPTIIVGESRVTGFSPKSIENAGLVKLDILGLNTLRDIQLCLRSINERFGVTIDPWNLPYDPKVFDEFGNGHTETVFQFDTNVVRPYVMQILPRSIDDLANITALCRPGTLNAPAENNQTLSQVYVARRKGEAKITYIHNDLQPILRETEGIQLFQEQTLRIYRDIGGFTYEEAEVVRKGIGKKDKKVLEDSTFRLKEACIKRGWSDSQVKMLVDQIMASADYSFNKSHAISYAYVAYACMWLKVNYKLDWWKSALCNASKDEFASKFWKHIQDFTDLPDINKSGETFKIVGDKIVTPISMLKGVGEKAYTQLIKYAPYKDIENFVNIHLSKRSSGDRSAITTGTAKKLIAGGILDSLYDKAYSVEEKLEIFENLKATAKGEYAKPIAKEYVEFIGITDLGRYMVKKQLVSVYSKDLRPIMLPHRGGQQLFDSKGRSAGWKIFSHKDHEGKDCYKFVLDGHQLDYLREKFLSANLDVEAEEREWDAIAYVIEEKAFPYQNKSKQATKLVLDIGGYFTEEMLWPAYGESQAKTGFKGLPCLVTFKERAKKREISLSKIRPLIDPEKLDTYVLF